MLIQLDPPRFEESDRLLIAGLSSRYTFETSEGIPRQWQRFAPYIGNLAGQIGPETYGVSHKCDSSGFEYIAGVKVSHFAALPDGFETVRIGRQRYTVFQHGQHVSMLRRTHYTIWNKWLPDSGKVIADAPNFERYGKQFDPVPALDRLNSGCQLRTRGGTPDSAYRKAYHRRTHTDDH